MLQNIIEILNFFGVHINDNTNPIVLMALSFLICNLLIFFYVVDIGIYLLSINILLLSLSTPLLLNKRDRDGDLLYKIIYIKVLA